MTAPRRPIDGERLAHALRALEAEASALRSLADSVPTALIWVARDGAIIGANRMAHDLSDSLGAFSFAKSLKWRHRRHKTQVDQCIAAALASTPSAVLLARREKPLMIVSARLVALPPAPMVPPEHRVALQLVPISAPAPLPPVVLQTLYGLTPSEARLAHALAERRNLADAARESGLSSATARTYLKKIFLKTGTSRQAQLVRLLWVKSGFLA